jgi:hypothetical protein
MREGHPTFPGVDDAAAQGAALDATLAAMEWPLSGEAEGGSAVLPCDPLAPPTAEAVAAKVFGLFFWTNNC